MSEAIKPGIEKLREHLFATLKGLSEKTMDIATAKAIGDICQTTINSAKVELEFQKSAKRLIKSEFFPSVEPIEAQKMGVPELSKTGQIQTKHGTLESNGNSTVHRMR